MDETKTDDQAEVLSLEIMRRQSQDLLNLPAEQVAVELDRRCLYCESFFIPAKYPHPLKEGRFTWVFPDHCGCDQETVALAQSQAQKVVDDARQIQDAQRAILKRAGLTGDLAKATFTNFTPRQDWEGAEDVKKRVMNYTREARRGIMEQPILLMYGQWGTGKSHLAAAAICEGLAAGKHCFFRNWIDYLQRIKSTWGNQGDPEKEQEADVINELRAGDIVAIDDLDKRTPTDWVRGVLYPVINHRTNEGKPTIITLNSGPDDIDPKAPGRSILETYFGIANLDRILGIKTFDIIQFDGPSFRTGVKWGK